MKKILSLVVVISMIQLAVGQTTSPELVSSAGDTYSNSSFQIDWSIGEPVIATHSSGSYIITQGFHQNFYVVTAIKNPKTEVSITAFPNPTTDLITVNLGDSNNNNLIILTDPSGKILQQKETNNKQELLNLSDYTKGIYFLTIKQENKLIQSFKIIKN